jgi:hypothetical protein
MISSTIPQAIEAYKKEKALFAKVLASPKPYYADVNEIMRRLWSQEQRIIAATGTIYNGL